MPVLGNAPWAGLSPVIKRLWEMSKAFSSFAQMRNNTVHIISFRASRYLSVMKPLAFALLNFVKCSDGHIPPWNPHVLKLYGASIP